MPEAHLFAALQYHQDIRVSNNSNLQSEFLGNIPAIVWRRTFKIAPIVLGINLNEI